MLHRVCPTVLMLLALLLPACSASSPPTATPQPVEIRFVYPSTLETAHFEQLKREFEAANPGLHVILTRADPNQAIASAAPSADVAEIDQIPLALLAQSGALRPLDPLVKESPDLELDAFYAGTIDALRWQGQLWALPSDVDPWVLYYNKDLFDSKGISYPTNDWTWDDLLDAAERLSEPDADQPLYGFVSAIDRADFVTFVYQNGGTLMDNLVDPKAVTFTDPATIEALEWYTNLALGYKVMHTPDQLKAMGGFDAVVDGQRAAMWFGPFSERGGRSSGLPWQFKWGMAVEPGRRQRMTLITMRAFVLSQKTSHPSEAWKWLKFLALHPANDLDLPALKSAAEAQSLLAGEPAEHVYVARESLKIGHTIPPTTWIDSIGGWLGQALDAVFRGDMSVTQAMSEAQDKANKLLAQQGSS